MDNSNLGTQAPAQPSTQPQTAMEAPITPNIASDPAPKAVPVPPVNNSGGSNKVILWFVIGLIVIVALVGGIYFFLSRQQSGESQTAAPTATPVAEENLEQELGKVDVESGADNDFVPIDQDLQQL